MPCFKSVTENWRYFRFSPNLDSFVKLANSIFDQGRGRRSWRNVYFLKIEAKSFRDGRQDIERTQRVIWDHLLAFKGEIIQKQASFSLPNNSRVVLIYAVCSVFSFVLFSTPPRSFFRLNHVRKAWNRCSQSRFSSKAIILGYFDRNVGLCCCCVLLLRATTSC